MLFLKKSKQNHLSETDFHQEDDDIIRSSCSQMFLKRGFLKKLTIFTGKRMYCRLFLIKLMGFRPATLFKRNSQTGVFLCAHGKNFKYTFFLLNTPGGCFCISLSQLSCMPVFFNFTFSFGRNITLTFWLTYFSVYYIHSCFLTMTRL